LSDEKNINKYKQNYVHAGIHINVI